MISTILSVIDRLLKLNDYRNQRIQRIYRQLLEPAFKDLLLVHRDYIQMFEQVEVILSLPFGVDTDKYITVMAEAIDYLKKKRVEFEPIRVNLRILMTESQGGAPFLMGRNRTVILGPEADAVIEAILNYLESPQQGDRTMSHVLMYELVDSVNKVRGVKEIDGKEEVFSELGSDENELFLAHGQLHYSINRKISKLRENWSRVCEAFAQATIAATTMR